MRKSIVTLVLSLFATAAFAQPAKDGKGTLKPGQYAGVQECEGSANGVTVNVTSKKTYGVATCKSALQKAFIEDKKLCDGKAKRTKIEYSWSFGKGENATTGKHYFSC